jgi:hypothetical protein
MLSSTIARTSAKAMFDAMYAQAPQGNVLPPSAVIDDKIVQQTHISFLRQCSFPTEDWMVGAPSSHVSPPERVAAPAVPTQRRPGAKIAPAGAKNAPVLPVIEEGVEIVEDDPDLMYSPATPPAAPLYRAD